MRVHTFNVVPSLPESIRGLHDLAYNLRWCWDPEIMSVFFRLDHDLWEATNHNPIRMLRELKQEVLEAAARDSGFIAHLNRATESLREYIHGEHWFSRNHTESDLKGVAYFSAEFGTNESVPIYSGGLGVLAGDYLKAASDMGVPLTGVSLLYHQGYFRQYLNADGWQQEVDPGNDFYNLPIVLACDSEGQPIKIMVEYPGREVLAQIWRMRVGRAELLLLDSNVPENNPDDREITAQLYGGNQETRIRQEILLGIGGIRALRALKIEPEVFHTNEGHSAFLAIERIRELMVEHNVSFSVARQAVTASNVFTTHTPVPAGNDTFQPAMVVHYLQGFAHKLEISMEEFLDLGRQNPGDHNEGFCMTVLALNLAATRNGVSDLHGHVSRRMWRNVWPHMRDEDIPIGAITNGVHTRSWISHEIAALFDRYLGPEWAYDPSASSVWERVDRIPNAELWRTHERRRERLVALARKHLHKSYERRGATESELQTVDEVLDPSALTIGFARRFAQYKRANLILHNRERLKRLLLNKEHPVQFIIAGKAHPADDAGKDIIRQLVHFMRDPAIRNKIVFLEDYDINIARYMVQGVDLWLNTPRRPQEACGTSGMKAAANGVLNMSVLDGWWCEAYEPGLGWAIGRGEEYTDTAKQDEIESASVFELLEKEVVPRFYRRTADDQPREWVEMMKHCIRKLCPQFSAHRMVKDYFQQSYLRAVKSGRDLAANDLAKSVELASWQIHVRNNWNSIRLRNIETSNPVDIQVGQPMSIEAEIDLGGLQPEDVLVQAFTGSLTLRGEIAHGEPIQMQYDHAVDGAHIFKGEIPCRSSGRFGFALRVLPSNPSLSSPVDMKLIHWA